MNPEELARQTIDLQLAAAGWQVQDRTCMNLYAGRGVAGRYRDWLAAQQAAGRTFTPEQRWWLDKITEHIGVNLAVHPDDLGVGEFTIRAGSLSWRGLLGRG
jgi:hypothetical protein